MELKYGVLILAAGASTRMGTSKQLLKIGDQTLLQKTITTALAINPFNCTVVLGANYEMHRKNIEHLPIDILENTNWENGMGSSIKMGVHHIIKFEIDAFFILVCDQPLLTSAHLKNMAEIYERDNVPIVSSRYNSAVGVPALFDQSLMPSLLSLEDQEGAKRIILGNDYPTIEFEGGDIDLDTRTDYEGLINKKTAL